MWRSLSLALCGLFVLAVAAVAVPDLLTEGNLKLLGCAAPDTQLQFVSSSQPGNVFYPGDPVDLTIKVMREEGYPATLTLEVIEIGMRQNTYLDGPSASGMTNVPAVEVLGRRGKLAVPVKVDRNNPAGEVLAQRLPVPARYGTYLVTVAPDGQRPQFLCTLLRAMKPREGFYPDAPVFGEGQFLTHDNQDPKLIAERARTLARLGIKGIRIELGAPMQQPGGPAYDWTRLDNLLNPLADAKIKALVTMGGHPYWAMPFGYLTPACIPDKPDFSCMPKYYPEFGAAIEEFCRRYWKEGNGALWAIENWNEPWEGISISGWESDMRHYRNLQKLIAEHAHKVDPRIKTAAACSIMNTEDKFLTGDDRAEMIKNVDLFTDHYVPPRTCYGPMVAKYWGKQSTDTESWIAATEVLLPQVMCQYLASGQDRVTPWHPAMTYFSVPGAPMNYQMPNPVSLATNVFNVMITGRPFKQMLFKEHLPWAFQFGEGKDATVVLYGKIMPLWGADLTAYKDILWWQLQLGAGGTLTIDNRDGALEFYDIAGNREFAKQKTVTLPADYLTHYLRAPKGGVALITKRLAQAKLSGLRPVEIIARDFTTPVAPGAKLQVSLHNLLNRPIAGTLTVTPPATLAFTSATVPVKLAAGQMADVALELARVTPSPANAYPVAITFTSDAGTAAWKETLHELVARRGTRTIDGKLDDWADVPGVLVTATAQQVDPTQQAWLPFVEARTKQPDGSFAEVKLAWDDRCLYVAARVNDPTDYPGHQRLASWDEDQYFRSAKDDAICEALRPYEKFVLANMDDKKVAEQMKADPKWPEYETYLREHPEAQHNVYSHAARGYWEAKKRNPAATFADASYVYRTVPWGDMAWSGDVLQFGIDCLAGYQHHSLLPDTDRVPYGFHAMPDTDYEYSAYQCTDGKPELWRLLAPGVPRGHYNPRQPRAKFDQGPVPDGQLVVTRDAKVTTYEVAIPWTELRQWHPAAGQTFGFTFRVNNNNGPALLFGAEKSATKTNGLSLHPYWEGKPSCSVQWALGT